MPVAFDAVGPSSAGASAAAASSLTWSHTNNGNAIVVGCSVGKSPDTGLSTTATYGGVAMTPGAIVHSNGATAGFLRVFTLLNPPTGANDVVVTLTGGTGDLTGGSISVTGAGSFVTQYSAFGGGATTATATSVGNTTGGLICAFVGDGGGTTSATSPSTSRFIKNLNGNTACGNCAGATSPSTSANVTTAWTITGPESWVVIGVEVLPADQLGSPSINPGLQSGTGIIPFLVDPRLLAETTTEVGGTNAPAESADATGIADDIQATIAPEIPDANSTGVAHDVQASIAVNAEVATGTGDAQAVANIDISSEIQSADATGTSSDPQINITVNATEATGTGVAQDPTVVVGTIVFPDAATGSGVAQDPQITISTNINEAAATGDATQGQASIGASGGTGTGSGDAQQLQADVAPVVPSADATGAGNDATTSIAPVVQSADATGTSNDPQVSVATSITAATATGTSEQAQPSVAPSAPDAQASGDGQNIQGVNVSSNIDPALGNGTANDATVSIGGFTSVNPTTATGTGDSQNVSAVVAVTAQDILNLGIANNTQAALRISAALADAVGAAFAVEFSTGELVPITLTTYVLSNRLTTIVEGDDTTNTFSNRLTTIVEGDDTTDTLSNKLLIGVEG